MNTYFCRFSLSFRFDMVNGHIILYYSQILPEPTIISWRIRSVSIIISGRGIFWILIPWSIAPTPGDEVYLHVDCLLPPIGWPVVVAGVIGPGGQASVDTRVPYNRKSIISRSMHSGFSYCHASPCLISTTFHPSHGLSTQSQNLQFSQPEAQKV